MNKEQILEVLREELDCGFTGTYQGSLFVVVGDWEEKEKIEKKIDMDFDDIMVALGSSWSDWGFSDEYTTCSDCGTIIRTTPTSAHWVADYCVCNSEMLCSECIKKDPTSYLETITNNYKNANTILSEEELKEQGYKLLEGDYESHIGNTYNDDPQTQLEELLKTYDEVVFDITGSGQFGTSWQVWVKKDIEE